MAKKSPTWVEVIKGRWHYKLDVLALRVEDNGEGWFNWFVLPDELKVDELSYKSGGAVSLAVAKRESKRAAQILLRESLDQLVDEPQEGYREAEIIMASWAAMIESLTHFSEYGLHYKERMESIGAWPAAREAFEEGYLSGCYDQDCPDALPDLPLTIWRAAGWLAAEFGVIHPIKILS